MGTIGNSQNIKQFAKSCKNGCGKLIRWDATQNRYFEIDPNDRRRSPNWNAKQEHIAEDANHKITQEQQIYVDTIGPIVLKILSEVQGIKRILILMQKREESATKDVYGISV